MAALAGTASRSLVGSRFAGNGELNPSCVEASHERSEAAPARAAIPTEGGH